MIEMFDMSPYPDFFKDLDSLFDAPATMKGMRGMTFSAQSNSIVAKLPVLKCGLYDYSVAPTYEDLIRIDWDRFELSPEVRDLLSGHYGNNSGFGFLVCKCSENGSYPAVGITHPTLANGKIFLPTMHEHAGGGDTDEADWDHTIYVMKCGSNVLAQSLTTTLGNTVPIGKKYPARHPSSTLDFTKLPADFPTTLTDNAIHFLGGFTIVGPHGNGDLTLIDSGRLAEQRWKGCSYEITGSDNYVTQDWYKCTTCFPNARSDLGICSHCASVHSEQGHQVVLHVKNTAFFCDGPALEQAR